VTPRPFKPPTEVTADGGLEQAAATARVMFSGASRLEQRLSRAAWIADPATPAAAPTLASPPIAVVTRSGSALSLAAVDAMAERHGLKPGLALADARAMVPDLLVAPEDREADLALLGAIADWADRYTPLIALDGIPAAWSTREAAIPPSGLFLEIAGSAHLFGGEAALGADLRARLENQGFAARVAIAGTPGAAWAFARLATSQRAPVSIVASGEERAVLASLPLLALRLPSDTVAGLERVGLKTVGALLDQPRAPLARRFGPLLALRLDQALGREEEPVVPRRPVPALVAERRFAEPILSESDVAETARSLAAALAQTLENRGEGARALELAVFRVDGVVTRVAVGTSRPLRDPAMIIGLFAERLKGLGEELDVGYGFETVRLSVLRAERDDPAQVDLSGGAEAEADLARLIDRLGARLGLSRVMRVLPVESHIPEAAMMSVAASRARVGGGWGAGLEAEAGRPQADEPIDRPVRLFARPEPIEAVAEVPEGPPIRFRWRRALYDVARYEGPERIAAEWWKGPRPTRALPEMPETADSSHPGTDPGRGADETAALPPGTPGLTRDYFRVEDEDGRRFWVFREGLYEREVARPRWFLQGVFA
jgi:protein ImuB